MEDFVHRLTYFEPRDYRVVFVIQEKGVTEATPRNISIQFDKLEFVNTYYHKDIYLKFSFVFPNIL